MNNKYTQPIAPGRSGLGSLLLLGLGLFGALFAPNRASAQYWYANPDVGTWRDYFRAFNREDYTGEEPTVTVVSNPAFGNIWRIRKPSGAKRAEFSRPQLNGSDYNFQSGNVYYIGFRTRFKILNNITLENDDIAVFQFKTDGNGSQYYPFTMTWNPKTQAHELKLHGVVGSGSVASHGTVVWRNTLSQGLWTNIVIGFKYSTSSSDGWVSIWRNGTKQTLSNIEPGANYQITNWGDSNRRAYHRTQDTATNYAKWGAYNESSRKYDMQVELSDLRIARTYADALPQ